MGVNKVILLGNLGKDPELRYTSQQFPISSFSVATSERRKDQDGQWKDMVEWHNVVTLGKTAENCSKYLKKGSQAFIEGKIRTRKWQDKEGKDRWTTEIVADTVQFIGSKSEGGSRNQHQEAVGSDQSYGGSVLDSLPTADQLSSNADSVMFDDDDIPF